VSVVTPARTGLRVRAVRASAYTIPTDAPESDGTFEWDSTTLVVTEVEADGGEAGLGYTYGPAAVATVIDDMLADVVEGSDPMAPAEANSQMHAALRNAGQVGIGALAISAVDVALWDLKAKAQGVCLADALPRISDDVPVYGSGGFTSYSDEQLREQFLAYRDAGVRWAKMKVGRDPDADPHRMSVAKEAAGEGVELMVDANGAFHPTEAIERAEQYAEFGVHYFEEPVSSDDVQGLRRVRDAAPAGMQIAAGEYAWAPRECARLLAEGAVDVLQADVTRVGGVTGFIEAASLAAAADVPFSAHCAPAISVHVCCAAPTLAHLEYFHDHVRIESMLFEGAPQVPYGRLVPDRQSPGLGLSLRRDVAEEYAA
jgi:L-alanine-DL-glutamate epimerase-like enolase superfamily enzyme